MAKGGAGKQTRKKHKGAERASQSRAGAAAMQKAGRDARRNTAKQQRQHARLQQLEAHRAAGGGQGPPKVISVVAAGAGANTADVVRLILSQSSQPGGQGGEDDAMVTTPVPTSATMAVPKQRQRLTLLQPDRTIAGVLDAQKAADVLLLVIPAEGGLDALGTQLVDALCMQGVGTAVGVLTGADALPPARRSTARKEWSDSLLARFPSHSKFFALDADPSGGALFRHLLALTPKPLSWRANASYVLSHAHTYVPDDNSAAAATALAAAAPLVHASDANAADPSAPATAPSQGGGLLTLYGYVRGDPLSIDRAIHVPHVGDVLPESIMILPDPHPLRTSHHGGSTGADGMVADVMEMESGAAAAIPASGITLTSSGNRMQLQYLAEGDGDLDGEQTWPTAQELAEADALKHNDDDDDDDDEMDDGPGGRVVSAAHGASAAASSSNPLMAIDHDDGDDDYGFDAQVRNAPLKESALRLQPPEASPRPACAWLHLHSLSHATRTHTRRGCARSRGRTSVLRSY